MANTNFGVSREATQAGDEILDVLEERDLAGLGIISFSSFGGVVVGQEVADRILPYLGLNREPENATDFAASGGVKTGVALGFGMVAARMSGIATLASAFMGVGSLASAGADFVNAIQRTGLVAESPTGSLPKASATVKAGGSGNANQPATSRQSSGSAGKSRSDLPY